MSGIIHIIMRLERAAASLPSAAMLPDMETLDCRKLKAPEMNGISTTPITGQPPVKKSFHTSPGMTVRSRPRKL